MNWNNILDGTLETVLMTFISTLFAYLVGIPLGVVLNITSKDGIAPNKIINKILGTLINILRSIPCMLLIILLLPLTRAIFSRGTGAWYTMIVPLFFSSFPFVSRMVEQSLAEVDHGEVEAVYSMGASKWQIITKVLLKESFPSLIMGTAVSMISIVGYTAFAYDFGAGGLISQAYAYYQSHTANYLQGVTIWIIVLAIIVIVQVIQEIGLHVSAKCDKRRLNYEKK